jgi:hypothetical protein
LEKLYHGHAVIIKCPGNDVNLAENRVMAMQRRARAKHDTLNGRSSLRSFFTISQ